MDDKIYAAIGHFKGSTEVTSLVSTYRTKKSFRSACYGISFVPYVILTEKMIKKLFTECAEEDRITDDMATWDQVKKLTSNSYVWPIVTAYIKQRGYLITNKVDSLKEKTKKEVSELGGN